MQNKRNISSISNSAHNHQSSTLMQPLISIAKASTPVRTRLVTASSPINSTPISSHKIGGFGSRSPNNKQNFFNNHARNEGVSKPTTHQISAENRLNLSPIMALNKKPNEGGCALQKKALTPQGVKISSDAQEGVQNALEKNYSTMKSSNSSLIQANTYFSDLRVSNSFKNLIEPKFKTINQENSSCRGLPTRKESTANLKQSIVSVNLLDSLVNSADSQSNSRCFNKFKPFNSSSPDANQTKCMNNDGKRAKYRVANQDNDGADLFYCSKCTIPLVQQGFIVQEITNSTLKEQLGVKQSLSKGLMLRSQLESKRDSLHQLVMQLNSDQQQDLGRLNSFYQRVFNYLQQQQTVHNQQISQHYISKKKQPIRYLQNIQNELQSINEMTQSPLANRHEHLHKLLQTDEQTFLGQGKFSIQPNQLFNAFTQSYQQQFCTILRAKQRLQKSATPNQSAISRTNPMRFSFERLLTDISNKKTKMQSVMKPLQEEDEEEEAQNYQEHKKQPHTAFRDLFPEEEDSEQVNNDIHSPTFKNF